MSYIISVITFLFLNDFDTISIVSDPLDLNKIEYILLLLTLLLEGIYFEEQHSWNNIFSNSNTIKKRSLPNLANHSWMSLFFSNNLNGYILKWTIDY